MASPDIHSRAGAITPHVSELNASGSDAEASPAEQHLPGPPPSLLENLPAELRDHILLHIPDLPTLRSLVRASPTMHAQYHANRDAILRACLARELDGCFPDAYACLNSRMRKDTPTRTDDRITRFLGGYRLWLSSPDPLRPDRDLPNADSCRWLAAFHLSVVRPLTGRYVKWALANLARASEEFAGGQETADAEGGAETGRDGQSFLSRSEEIRVFRALYRYETFHHLFGRNEGHRDGGFRDHELNHIFLCLFDPWEAEALACIDLFIRDRYRVVFAEVKWDLDDRNPVFWEGGFNPSGSFDLDGLHDNYLDGTICRGLEIAARAFAITDHQTLVDEMQRCITHRQENDDSLRKTLGLTAQLERRVEFNQIVPQDEAERRRDPMGFVGDVNHPAGPPLAWVLLWNGKYSNLYGGYTPSSVKDWGYVMWDERRWTELGSTDLVQKQWKTEPKLGNKIEQHYNWRPPGC